MSKIEDSARQEQIDFECIGQKLQKLFPNKFMLLMKMPLGHIFDAYSYSHRTDKENKEDKEERYIQEYKCRYDEDFDTYEDCFIEPNKFKNLREWCDKHQDIFPGVKPLYINSQGEEAKEIYIWDLSQITEYNFHPQVWIKTSQDYQDRYGLLWEDCCKLEWDDQLNGYKLIGKGEVKPRKIIK